ncbi:MAG: sodium:solute symporter family protein, partial [Pseudomonadota bacterium]
MDSVQFSLAFALIGYALLCLFIGIKSAAITKSAAAFAIADRNVGTFSYLAAVTAATFSGLTFLSHPGNIFANGFPYAFVSLYAITIPITGVIFFKRQWLLAKRFGFVTPGDMYANYFRSESMRFIVLLVALIVAIPIIAIQFRLTGALISQVTNGAIEFNEGMWVVSLIVIVYAALGGMEAAARIGVYQFIAMVVGIVGLGLFTINTAGGFDGVLEAIRTTASLDLDRTPQGFSHYLALPGVMQYVESGPAAVGGEWTALMVFSYVLGFMGIMAAPAFTMWAFAASSPSAQGAQQVWGSAFIMGGVLVFFCAVIGFTPHILGADPLVNLAVRGELQTLTGTMSEVSQADVGGLVLRLIMLTEQVSPFLIGLLTLCALAAIQSTVATFLTTSGSMLSRDLVQAFMLPAMQTTGQIMLTRFFTVLVAIVSLLLAANGVEWVLLAGSVAVAIGLQMWPALIAVCFVPWITRPAIILGLVAGIVAVIATEKIGGQLGALFGYQLPWGRWPLTIHAAAWGLLINLLVVVVISALSQTRELYEHRARFHRFLSEAGSVGRSARLFTPIGLVLLILWAFFAIGPGAVVGNTLFGDPNDPGTWSFPFGLPPLWGWQIGAWLSGVAVLWLLAFRMRLSGRTRVTVEP